MKKFVIGLTCGTVFSFATGVVASSGVEAILFPSEIKYHGYEGVSEINGNDTTVLNYRNSVYVPLRLFAETMGAIVNYREPEGNTPPKIDIYPKISISAKELIYTDEWNYVSIGYIQPISEYEKVGVVKANKDLSHKVIVLEALNENGEVIQRSDYVHITQQDAAPPQAGDIRSFRTKIRVEHERIHSYKVRVVDLLDPVLGPDISTSYGNPIGILFSPPQNYRIPEEIDGKRVIVGPYGEIAAGLEHFVGYMNRGDIIPIRWSIFNTSTSNLIIEPLNIELIVSKLHADRTETVVYRKKIPTISGLWKSKHGYDVRMPWDVTDQNGKPLDQGTYKMYLKVPETIQYKIEGSNEEKIYEPFVRFNNFYFNLE